MDLEHFWRLVQLSRDRAIDCQRQAMVLVELLEQLRPEEIIAFDRCLARLLLEAYRYDLWAVAYIVNVGCSDDCFEYFRGWLIAQGRESFEAAMKSPVLAATHAQHRKQNYCEDLLYVADIAYERKTGRHLPPLEESLRERFRRGPHGEPWDEDDLAQMYPELYGRFAP